MKSSNATQRKAIPCNRIARSKPCKKLKQYPAALAEACTLQSEFMAALPELDGQARTVAARFAVTAAALELAARHGITGQSAGLAFPAIKQCFDTWLERNGTGKHEDRKILENAINFASGILTASGL